jgi:hypothetical protein
VKICDFISAKPLLLYEFGCVSFEPFFALQAAEVVGFSIVSNLELGCIVI